MDVKGNNELLVLTRPQVISEIHEQYLAAGADIIETNTFGATGVAQEDYKMAELAYEMNVEAAKLARAACDKYSTPDKPRFVAGAFGPTPKTASISPDVNDPGARNVTFEELRKSYYEQGKGLLEGGADVFLVETIFDTLNAKACLFAIDQLFEDTGERLPVMISGTVTDASGRILSGQTVEAFWNSLRHVKPVTFGLNCALGATLMRPYIAELAKVCDVAISCYPNAGLPNPMSDTGFDERRRSPRRWWRSSRLPASSTWWADAAAPRQNTLPPLPSAWPTRPRARGRASTAKRPEPAREQDMSTNQLPPRRCASPAWSRSRSTTTRCSSTSASVPTSRARRPSPA